MNDLRRMMRFNFNTSADLLAQAAELGISLPYRDSIEPLMEPFTLNERAIPNRLAVHPMEGFDGEVDGSPGELTSRRYRRFARGGSGLIWFEATSVIQEGRSNPRQLMLDVGNLDGFKHLLEMIREEARTHFGQSHDPYLVLQLTHSGRYSKPEGTPAPLLAAYNPHLDDRFDQFQILSDDELERLQEKFIAAAGMACKAGFDAVDIKACHGYLLHDLLVSFAREKRRFGGEDLEARSRFMLEVIDGIRTETRALDIAVRLSLYDGLPWPYGFGVREGGDLTVDLSEPLDLINRLRESGCSLLNVTAGVPHLNAWMGRPFNRTLSGDDQPPEHPLEGIVRLIDLAGEVQVAYPDLPVVGTGYSWLRQFFPNVGAAVLDDGRASLIGLGRNSFAYPDAPADLMEKGQLEPLKVCLSCSGCTELMRHGRVSGCIVRDREIYSREYRLIRTQRDRKEN